MFHFKKSIFLKLYRYYLKKLFFTWLLLLALVSFFVFSNAGDIWGFLKNGIGEMENIWNRTWLISLAKAFSLIMLSSSFIYSLVNQAKIAKEDASILAIASPINRQSMFVAKIATCFTYHWVSNLLFSLPIIFLSAGSSGSAMLVFLLFDSFLLVLVNFLLFYTPLFYLYFPTKNKKLKFLVFLLYLAFPLLFLLIVKWEFFSKTFGNPWIPGLYSLFIGTIFLYLHWNDFRQHGYT
ncbi:MAG: hypothetical protein MRECE_3c011 [Mycoplasmataceae bacterium CE_OT135]|nr:MAG: hypothetical protein MRECE_3c011 [Mycoplasmataceae bacterium CE_OT135]